MQLNYRKATQSDYSCIYEIQKKYVLRFEDQTIVNIKDILERIEMNLKTNLETYTCVLQDEEVIGYYRIEEDYDFFYDLSFLYVNKEYRRIGIGSQIIDYIKKDCDDAIQANVIMKDTILCSFLEKNSFSIKRVVSKSRMVLEFR